MIVPLLVKKSFKIGRTVGSGKCFSNSKFRWIDGEARHGDDPPIEVIGRNVAAATPEHIGRRQAG
ncbi:hypothetical protein ATY77_27545 [Rhizobium sp. R634]|nr:hypothetical protein ATY77_27545 [Rhizobium sp. R634]